MRYLRDSTHIGTSDSEVTLDLFHYTYHAGDPLRATDTLVVSGNASLDNALQLSLVVKFT